VRPAIATFTWAGRKSVLKKIGGLTANASTIPIMIARVALKRSTINAIAVAVKSSAMKRPEIAAI
jgi:hypothetical protein